MIIFNFIFLNRNDFSSQNQGAIYKHWDHQCVYIYVYGLHQRKWKDERIKCLYFYCIKQRVFIYFISKLAYSCCIFSIYTYNFICISSSTHIILNQRWQPREEVALTLAKYDPETVTLLSQCVFVKACHGICIIFCISTNTKYFLHPFYLRARALCRLFGYPTSIQKLLVQIRGYPYTPNDT